jgi:DNA replication protein DnaC
MEKIDTSQAVRKLIELRDWMIAEGRDNGKSYTCERCHDLGLYSKKFKDDRDHDVENVIKCDCRKLREEKESLERAGIHELFADKDIHNFKAETKEQKEAAKTACEYIRNFSDESLVYYGRVGSGKTHLAVAVAKELQAKGHRVKFWSYPELIDSVIALKREPIAQRDLISKVRTCPVLVLDDLFKNGFRTWSGKKVIDPDHKSIIYKIVDYRMNNRLPMIVTTEFGLEEFFEFEEAITSRLIGMAGDNSFEFKTQENMRFE